MKIELKTLQVAKSIILMDFGTIDYSKLNIVSKDGKYKFEILNVDDANFFFIRTLNDKNNPIKLTLVEFLIFEPEYIFVMELPDNVHIEEGLLETLKNELLDENLSYIKNTNKEDKLEIPKEIDINLNNTENGKV